MEEKPKKEKKKEKAAYFCWMPSSAFVSVDNRIPSKRGAIKLRCSQGNRKYIEAVEEVEGQCYYTS
jgi:hypothetical protein